MQPSANPIPVSPTPLDDVAPTAEIKSRTFRYAPGRTTALAIDEITTELRRRIALYRGPYTNNERYLAKAEALETFLWWVEATR